jgi:NSS family neurotransmitter:Na+ symporter
MLAVFFFLALSIAAFSSLLPMIELLRRNLNDLGLTRKHAFFWLFIIFFIFGFPSAWSLDFFNNQDWVWGLGLIITGLMILIAVAKEGPTGFKEEMIDLDSEMRVSTFYFRFFIWINIPLALILIIWWLSQGYSEYPWLDKQGRWNFFDVYSNASVITQWMSVILAGFLLNGFLYRKFAQS